MHLVGLRDTGVLAPTASQRRAHARHELAQPERLGHVVVGTHLEPHDRVDLGVARGHHDDRHLRARPDLAAHVDAGDARQHHVEQHQRGTHRVEARDGLGPVGRDLDPEPLALQRDPQRVAVRLLVVDHEDQRRFGHQTISCCGDRSAADSGSSGSTKRNVEP